jgi:methionyl-tRNA synthetase
MSPNFGRNWWSRGHSGYLDKTFAHSWPADYHIIGKDIVVPAPAIYWPTMLHALHIELPKTLLAHDWWLISGEKISKSAGNVVNLLECIEKFGVDAFRYDLMREMTIGQDGDFSFDRFMTRYTGDLANDLGNPLSRLLNMGHRYCDGIIKDIIKTESLEEDLRNLWQSAIPEIISLYNGFAFRSALEKLFLRIKAVNGYVENHSPWKLAKSDEEGNKQLIDTIIAISAECVRLAAILLSPGMPTTSQQIFSALGCPASTNWDTNAPFGNSLTGNKLGEQIILFPKIEEA